ncbi:MAG: peptidylprolyl isomerase [Chloroflexota bacterium]
MSFRNRPILDRKHRPRWQDELRTQRLIVAGFAIAIALALGIFGATAWSTFWEANLRPVAVVGGTEFDREQLAAREHVLTAERTAQIADLQSQVGGARDQIIQQQVDQLTAGLSSVTGDATKSLVDGQVLEVGAAELGITITDKQVDAEIAKRRTRPTRVGISLIVIQAKAATVPAGQPAAKPTEAAFKVAQQAAAAALKRVNGGQAFANVAKAVSTDATAQTGGKIGLVAEGDATYGAYVKDVGSAPKGKVVGPIRTDLGYILLKVEERVPGGTDATLVQLLNTNGVGGDAYRDYIRDQVLLAAFKVHFSTKVVAATQAQRRVAQIFIAAGPAAPVHEVRVRHVLVQPLPGQQDQTPATPKQWAAALAKATAVRAQLAAPNADWFAIAAKESSDPGSKDRGGDLGWQDPTSTQFVPEFGAAIKKLKVGALSAPVRTQFGYHLIAVTAERESPSQEAANLVIQLRKAPDTFGTVARQVSEDAATAAKDGELGWVAQYELDAALETAIFALDKVGDISEPIAVPGGGTYIYKLLEVSESRAVPDARLKAIRSSGFERWLADIKRPAKIWIDPQFASSTTG